MHGFGKPKHSVYFLVFQWDKGISKKNHKKLVRGAIRLPIIFLRLNTMLKGKKQRKVALIMKLAISNFRCPGETHITNFTRLPLGTMSTTKVDSLPRSRIQFICPFEFLPKVVLPPLRCVCCSAGPDIHHFMNRLPKQYFFRQKNCSKKNWGHLKISQVDNPCPRPTPIYFMLLAP